MKFIRSKNQKRPDNGCTTIYRNEQPEGITGNTYQSTTITPKETTAILNYTVSTNDKSFVNSKDISSAYPIQTESIPGNCSQSSETLLE